MAVRPERRRQATEELVAAGPQALQVLAACLTQDGGHGQAAALTSGCLSETGRAVLLVSWLQRSSRLCRPRQEVGGCLSGLGNLSHGRGLWRCAFGKADSCGSVSD